MVVAVAKNASDLVGKPSASAAAVVAGQREGDAAPRAKFFSDGGELTLSGDVPGELTLREGVPGEFTLRGGVRCPGGVSLDADELLPEDALLPDMRRRWSSSHPGLDRLPSVVDHEASRDAAVVGVVRGDTPVALPPGREPFLCGEKESMGGGSTRAWFQPLDRSIDRCIGRGGGRETTMRWIGR